MTGASGRSPASVVSRSVASSVTILSPSSAPELGGVSFRADFTHGGTTGPARPCGVALAHRPEPGAVGSAAVGSAAGRQQQPSRTGRRTVSSVHSHGSGTLRRSDRGDHQPMAAPRSPDLAPGPPGPYTLRFTSTGPAFRSHLRAGHPAEAWSMSCDSPPPSGPAVVGSGRSPPRPHGSSPTPATSPLPTLRSCCRSQRAARWSLPARSATPPAFYSCSPGPSARWRGSSSSISPLPGGISTRAVFVDALPDVPTRLRQVSGDSEQSAPINSTLPVLLVVQVAASTPLVSAGVTVQWRTCDDRGALDLATDDHGLSSATQSTGPVAGNFCVKASSAGLDGSPVEFHFTVTPSSASVSGLRGGNLRGRHHQRSPAANQGDGTFAL